jgi:hypothetical protein
MKRTPVPNAVAHFEAVIALLRNPANWTTRAYAKTSTGTPCGSVDERAVCWCLEGARLIFPISNDAAYKKSTVILQEAIGVSGVEAGPGIPVRTATCFNDSTDHDTLMKVLYKARDLAVERG